MAALVCFGAAACSGEGSQRVAGGGTAGAGAGGGGVGGAGTGGAVSLCPGQDHTPPVCEGAQSSCETTYEAAAQTVCSTGVSPWANSYGECGPFLVTVVTFENFGASWCFYDPQSKALVGTIVCTDLATGSCQEFCKRDGPVAQCCEQAASLCTTP